MRRIRPDLWETTAYSPFEGLTTHAYLWVRAGGGNVLFYATGSDDDHDAIESLGGVAHQYLSHRDEAGPALASIAERFGARLHASAAEMADVARFREPDVLFEQRHVDANGVEVVPTPGHSPGSTCFLVPGAGEETYLFTGDTIFLGRDGRWRAGYIEGISDAGALAASLELLGTLRPDLVASSAFTGDAGVHDISGRNWDEFVQEALATLPA